MLAIPALVDIIASTLAYFCAFFLAASISKMMLSIRMLTACILSIIFLKKRYFRHHWNGFVIILVGIIIVALNAIVKTKKNPTAATTATTPLGVNIYLFSLIFQGTQALIEEAIFWKYVPPI